VTSTEEQVVLTEARRHFLRVAFDLVPVGLRPGDPTVGQIISGWRNNNMGRTFKEALFDVLQFQPPPWLIAEVSEIVEVWGTLPVDSQLVGKAVWRVSSTVPASIVPISREEALVLRKYGYLRDDPVVPSDDLVAYTLTILKASGDESRTDLKRRVAAACDPFVDREHRRAHPPEPKRDTIRRDVGWLAENRIGGLGIRELGRRDQYSEAAVSVAVRDAAGLLGITKQSKNCSIL
jgi:hypothetical protein